jgi:hypothetical protein
MVEDASPPLFHAGPHAVALGLEIDKLDLRERLIHGSMAQ